VEEQRPPFSWSVSRHDTFNRCRRRYYYSYYGARDDPEIQRLKRLSALPLWAGNVVHEEIEKFLTRHDGLPSEQERELLIRTAVHERMLADWNESEARGAFRLFEHEYDIAIEPDDKKIVVGTVRRSLRNFFQSPTLAEALAAGRDAWLTIEDLSSYMIGDVPVYLRMDLAFRNRDGQVVIVDWKTGQREGRFSEVQLAGYALYASENGWVQEPELLLTELAYLAIPRYVRRSVNRRSLASARRFIEKSCHSMKELLVDPTENIARLEDFPMIDRPHVCRRCNFRRLCFPPTAEATTSTRSSAGSAI
jgi:CRISPR/Cas system-associated exonuclease Cas4 (RecB family)